MAGHGETLLCGGRAPNWQTTHQFGSFESVLRHIWAIPPSATKCLKQCGGIGVAISLGLNEGNKRLPISLLCTQEREIAHVTDLHLFGSEVERNSGCIACRSRSFQGIIVLIKCMQAVRDIFKCR